MTLKDFVHHPTKGMRAYTEKLARDVCGLATSEESTGHHLCASNEPNRYTLGAEQVVDLVARNSLPLYIFSGVQQVYYFLVFFFW